MKATSNPWDSERARVVAAVGCAIALLVALSLPTLRGQLYLDSDLGDFYVPVRAFYQQALRAGTDYLWYPYEFSGFYLHGEGQAALTHPLNLLSYRWLPLTLAYGLEIVRSYAFALLGAYLFFRRYALPASAALLGAVYFAFASFQLLHYMHPNVVGAVAHLPWQLLALHSMANGATPLRRALAAPWLALLTTSQLLLGHPQAVWLCGAVEVSYALLLWRAGVGFLLRAAAASALGLLAAAVQLLPVWETLRQSLRAMDDSDFAATFSLHPLNFAQLVQPYLFRDRVVLAIGIENTTELGLYAGAFGALALPWLALTRQPPGPVRSLGRGALVLALLGAWLALGAYGGLQPLISGLPLLGLFRAPCRYLLWIHIAVSVAVALCFARLIERGNPAPGRAWNVALLALPLLSAALALALPAAHPELVQPARYAAIGVVCMSAAALLVFAAQRGSAGAALALLLLACADLGAYGLSYIAQREPRPASLESVRAGIRTSPGDGEYRRLQGAMIDTLVGVRYVWGYVAMWPIKLLPVFPRDMSGKQLDSREKHVWRASLSVASVMHPIVTPLPRVRLLTYAQRSRSLHDEMKSVDVARVALVSHSVVLDAGPPGKATIASETPGEFLIATSTPGRQLLVLSESYHEGWRAWIDGAPAELVRAYGDYMGCVVPSGEHRVRLHFEPTSFATGARVSAGALAAIAVWLCVALARSRRRYA